MRLVGVLLALCGLGLGIAAEVRAATPAPAPVERLNRELNGYLNRAGYPAPLAPVLVAPAEEFNLRAPNAAGNAGLTLDEGTLLEREWLRYQHASGMPSPDLVQMLIHEQLHRIRATDGRYATMDRGREEGVVEAATADLTRRWYASRGWAVKVGPSHGYRRGWSWVRKLSARATGSPWNSAPARRWRRALLLGDEPTRDQMFQAVQP